MYSKLLMLHIFTSIVFLSTILVSTRTPVPASHVIFIISAPLLYLNHRIHVLKLSEIISKDGEYIGDFRFRRGLPSERHSYLYLTYSARVCIWRWCHEARSENFLFIKCPSKSLSLFNLTKKIKWPLYH